MSPETLRPMSTTTPIKISDPGIDLARIKSALDPLGVLNPGRFEPRDRSMRLPRFSIRQLMASVVVVALLIPFPWVSVVSAFTVMSVSYLILIFVILTLGSLGRP
jgi:hypothetical protein